MDQRHYYDLPGLEHVYLEDSFVLEIREQQARLEFLLDIVLTEEHPSYTSPGPGEQYCYWRALLTFPEVRHVHWLRKSVRQYTDAAGDVDLGNIDVLRPQNGHFYVEGDWGTVEIESDAPTITLLEAVEVGGDDA